MPRPTQPNSTGPRHAHRKWRWDRPFTSVPARQPLFHPGESNPYALRVLVRNVVLPMIGRRSLAMQELPLRSGIASFPRRSESYSERHHVFIPECHAYGRVTASHALHRQGR